MGVEKIHTDSVLSLQEDLLAKANSYLAKAPCRLIEKAFHFSKQAHKDQLRKTGEPFIEHPLYVAHILTDLHLDASSIIAGLLHDVVEDTQITLEKIKKEFGGEVSFLVDGMTKLSQIRFQSSYQKESENMRKMIVSMGRDVRVIIIKLADRLHNMRTLSPLSEKRKLRISGETLSIYAPLAGRLGLNDIKIELEDLSFKHIYPEVFSSIFQQFEKEKNQRKKYIKNVIEFLNHDLSKKTNIQFQITGRAKNMYSIYKKMKTQGVDYNQVHDIIAFRICTEKIHECYEILGWVHSLWKPISDRFKDFIAIPKSNNYQSLHTTVIGPEGKRVEIQIRTHDMHRIAEKGIAVHWKYKEESYLKNTTISRETFEKFSWLKDLLALHQQTTSSNEFLAHVKSDLFDSDIYVFTPKGEVKEFSKGATPIDFAYAIHTDLGHKLKSAKVNGRIVSLKQELKNGDVVEISTSEKSHPSREWLNHCVTSKARSRIRSHINEEERALAISMGMKILEKDLKKIEISCDEFLKNPKCLSLMKNLGLNTNDDLYSQIGYGKIISSNIIQKVIPSRLPEKVKKIVKKPSAGISPIEVEGMGNVMVQIAKCCSPLPGEDIMGYIRLEHGITVHRCECKQLLNLDSERFVHVAWKKKIDSSAKHIVSLKIIVRDHPGALKVISDIFADSGINIINLNAQTKEDQKADLLVHLEVLDVDHLRSTIRSLQELKIVHSVIRV